jgi:ATP-dependent Clp protease ATP-binding subunit ClpB
MRARQIAKARDLLKMNGVVEKDILTGLQTVRGGARVTDQSPEGKLQALEKYGIDLIEQARKNKVDPVIGRDNEIRRVIQVLSAAVTKNNPVLIGEPGVGKNRDCRRARSSHSARRRAAEFEEQKSDRSRYGCVDRRH